MEMGKMMLSASELPIVKLGKNYRSWLPIHPVLLRKDIKVSISPWNFSTAANLSVSKDIGYSRNTYYEITLMENGLADSMMISRNSGIRFREHYDIPDSMPHDKRISYSSIEKDAEHLFTEPPFGYQFLNAHMHSATFFRNLGILYLNAAMKEAARKVA